MANSESVMADSDGTPTYAVHDLGDGKIMRLAGGFPVEGFKSGLEYQAKRNDLYVVTYPKCGTTMTQHTAYLILNDGVPISADQRLDTIWPHLEEVGGDFVEDKGTVLDGYKDAKYLYVSRNPKDVVVSFYHHTVGFPRHYDFASGSFDTYFELFLDGKVDHGDYFRFLREALDRKDDSNVLFLRYEEARKDRRQYVLDIAKFLGDRHYDKLIVNDEKMLGLALEHSSIESMKANPRRWCSARDGFEPFIRSGKTGGWRELMSEEQAGKLQNRLKEKFTNEELEWLGEHYCS